MSLRIRGRLTALAAVTALALTGAACASVSNDPKVITYWTLVTDPITMKAWHQMAAGFEKENPGYRVKVVPKPPTGTGNDTGLITAVRGHTGPDVYLVDRYTTAQYAATGILQSLQPYVDKVPGLRDKYLKFAWDEGSYKGQLYSMSSDTDSRALIYNKTMLRQAGIDMSVFDPKNGPPTVDELLAMNKKLIKTKNGNYTQVGFIPWGGQAFWATWTLQRGATFFDNSDCTLNVLQKPVVDAYTTEGSWARQLGFGKVQAFTATYQPAGAPPSQTTFIDGKVAMAVDFNGDLAPIHQYAPKLDVGITYLPVQHKGDPPTNWSGGLAYVIPKYAHNPDGGWKFIRYAAGPEGQRIYSTVTSHLPTLKALLKDPKVIKGQEFFAKALAHSTSRPPLPVNAQLLTALSNAETGVLSGAASPRSALKSVQEQVAPNLKQYCPFKLPKAELSGD